MKKNFLISYFQRLIFNCFIKLISFLPLKTLLLLGRVVGVYIYHSNKKFKALKNLRIAFAKEKSPFEIRRILKKSCMYLGMNVFEVLKLPELSLEDLEKNVRYKNYELLKKYEKNPAIIIGAHFGNWELADAKIAQDFNYAIFVKSQKPAFWDEFLNSQRRKFGLEIIEETPTFLKKIKECIKKGKFIGFVADHGVNEKSPKIEFFGRKVSTPIGGVKIALKNSLPLIVGFVRRERRAYHIVEMYKELELEEILQDNLKKINKTLQEYIEKYPYEYNWYFKRFKFTSDRYILLLTDSKPGHYKQLESFLNVLKESEFEIIAKFVRVEFKSEFRKHLLNLATFVFYKTFPSILIYLSKFCLKEKSFEELFSFCPDVVISCGQKTLSANLIVSLENNSRNICILKPGIFPFRWFYKVFLPFHDKMRGKNVINFWGAVSFSDENRVFQDVEKLKEKFNIKKTQKVCVLLGGENKSFKFDKKLIISFLTKFLKLCRNKNTGVLLTTSRRTPLNFEKFLEEKLKDEFEILILANKENYPFIVGGFLGLSKKVIVTSDSVSMICEALSLRKEVYVLELPSKKYSKHHRFLESLLKEGYIYKVRLDNLEEIFEENRPVKELNGHLKKYILDSIK